MKLHLITYGCGKKFDTKKFKPIKNRMHVKPEGGLWSSPVGSSYGWREWCEAESWGDLSHHFTFDFEGNIYVINSLQDAAAMPWREVYESIKFPDFEAMVALGYDAIFLTENGQHETRFSEPSLYGWDCECVLVMNPSGVLTKRPLRPLVCAAKKASPNLVRHPSNKLVLPAAGNASRWAATP